MCLIAIKNKGIPLNGEFYKSLSRSYHIKNKDGAGFAILKEGSAKTYFEKGFYHVDDLINRIKLQNPGINDILVVHLRKTSAGNKSVMNMHPFIMSTKSSDHLRTSGKTCKGLLFHNGTFQPYVEYYSMESDTLRFVKLIAGINGFVNFFKHAIKSKKCANKLLGEQNKVAILHPKEGLLIHDQLKFLTDRNGFIYSNDSYHPSFTYNEFKVNRRGYIDELEFETSFSGPRNFTKSKPKQLTMGYGKALHDYSD